MNVDGYFKLSQAENNELRQTFNIVQKEMTPGNDVNNITSQEHETSTMKDLNSNFTGPQGQYYVQFVSNLQDTVKQEVTTHEKSNNSVAAENASRVKVISDQEKITAHAEFGQHTVYQTMTDVPSEDINGDISYILVVHQLEDGIQTGERSDMKQPDEEAHDAKGKHIEDDKSSIIKLPVKSSPFLCSYCPYTNTTKFKLFRHMKSHSSERPYKCSVCERSFKTPAALKNHTNMHNGIKPHHCRHCESSFTTSGELVRHVRYKHTHERPHKCEECSYSSVERSKLKRHMRCHSGERPYQCEHCTYASPDTFKLNRHLRTHTLEKPYQCDSCMMRFSQSNSLKAHKMIHDNTKPSYPCSLCPSTCGRKTDLRIHIKTQHTPEPKRCKKCGQIFSDRYTYRMHNRTHAGEKCFRCDFCPYASTVPRHLKSHVLIHLNQKPFACIECDLTFRQKQLLKRHYNLYHNPHYIPPMPMEKHHECQECGMKFRYEGNLVRHNMTVHGPGSIRQEENSATEVGSGARKHFRDVHSVSSSGQPILHQHPNNTTQQP